MAIYTQPLFYIKTSKGLDWALIQRVSHLLLVIRNGNEITFSVFELEDRLSERETDILLTEKILF